MREQNRVFLLILIMMVVVLSVTGITLFILYGVVFEQQRERLVETVESRASLIEAMAKFDAKYSASDYPGGAFLASLSQIREAHKHFKGFGETGEFTMAKADQIVFLLRHRHSDLENPKPVSFTSKIAEPMRHALSGESGTVIGLDYRGIRVLAAYTPVQELGLGIVAKIDLTEIRAPFMHASFLAGGCGFLLIMIVTFLFLRIGNPLIQRLKESELKYRTIFKQAADSIVLIDPQTGELADFNERAYMNLGYSQAEFSKIMISDIDVVKSFEEVVANIKEASNEEGYTFDTKHRTRDGDIRDVHTSNRSLTIRGKDYIQSIWSDITERKRAEEEREKLIHVLQEAHDEVETLSGLIPICSSCKKIRDDKGYWQHVELYIANHSNAEFSHGLCLDCAKRLYPDAFKDED
ncbi:PAS domain S-box protein [Thermodesulfobacteriota bacterium]